MFLLIQRISGNCYRVLAYLHSIMFLLIRRIDSASSLITWFTFHNVSINTNYYLHYSICPVWFTFHNVSINTVRRTEHDSKAIIFTFHNVSINTFHPEMWIPSSELHLHSIMFLLIQISEDDRFSLNLFTFHNVSINTVNVYMS